MSKATICPEFQWVTKIEFNANGMWHLTNEPVLKYES